MIRRLCMLTIAAMLVAGVAVGQDLIQGNWEGSFTQKAFKGKPVVAKVIAQGKDGYRAVLEVLGPDGKPVPFQMTGKLEKGKVPFSGAKDFGKDQGGEWKVSLDIKGAELTGKVAGKNAPGKFTMARVEKKPATLGAKPPSGAVVLFDGKSLDAWQPTEQPWKIVEGAILEVGKSNIVSKQEFGDCKIHLEFRTPFMPDKRGQARGNSGVYVQGRYEIQVLDSFGLPIADNECGGIYKKAVPKMNATLPPTEWQTYDITFHAPKFDDAGKKLKDAVINVEHNGIVIHDNAVLSGTTPGGVSGDEAKVGPLLLQEHHCQVQFRNVWVQPLS